MFFILVVPGARATKTLYFLFDGEALYVFLQSSLSTNVSIRQMNSCQSKFAFRKEIGLVGKLLVNIKRLVKDCSCLNRPSHLS